jgi:hypothetical protein
MMLINRFARSCGTFGDGKKHPNVVNDIGSTCLKKNFNFFLKKTTMGWMLT